MKKDLNENVRLRRKCLELISRMATKGALAPSPDASRCAMRMLAYGLARYNYNNPDMGPVRARKELRDLQEMYWWLNTESEDRGKRAHPPERKYKVPMVKVTGSQRIDLLGIKKADLPKVWAELGMPSGQAYTKGVRMVKTCVGTEFCRFGVQDSTNAGIELERRLENLFTPHKYAKQ